MTLHLFGCDPETDVPIKVGLDSWGRGVLLPLFAEDGSQILPGFPYWSLWFPRMKSDDFLIVLSRPCLWESPRLAPPGPQKDHAKERS